uniref:type II toxin-antitoxin system RelE family toxin n=1 Tax=Escherichia coli TaxID=562 RepID=UPI0006ACB4ED
MLPSETMIWQPEFTDKTLSRKPGAVHLVYQVIDEKVVVFVISVGKRERSEVYSEAVKRIL